MPRADRRTAWRGQHRRRRRRADGPRRHLGLAAAGLRRSAEEPAIEHLTPARFVTLSNPGVTSLQLLSPHNSASRRITLTRVSVAPGATNSRHAHATSEQVWYALAGSGTLLLAEGLTQAFAAGEVVRFADCEVHGFHNSGDVPFDYLSVTSPPIDFAPAYAQRKG